MPSGCGTPFSQEGLLAGGGRFRRSFSGEKGQGLPPQVHGHVSALGTRSRLPRWRDGPRGPAQTLRPCDPAQVSSRVRVHFLEGNGNVTACHPAAVQSARSLVSQGLTRLVTQPAPNLSSSSATLGRRNAEVPAVRVRREAWFPEDTGTGVGKGAAEPTRGEPLSPWRSRGRKSFPGWTELGDRHVDSCSSPHGPLERSVAGPREQRSFCPRR